MSIVDSENRVLVRSIPFSEITVGELGLLSSVYSVVVDGDY